MNTTPASADRKIVFLLAAICIITIAAAVFEYLASAKAIRSLEIARAQYSATETKLRKLRAECREDVRTVIELQSAAERIEKKPTELREAAFASSLEAGRKFLAAHPEDLQMLKLWLKYRAYRSVGATLRAVGCGEGEIEQAVQLSLRSKANYFGTIIDGIALADAGDLSPAEVQDQLKALIGDANYAKLRQHSQDEVARGLTAQVADVAGSSGSPLTREQNEAVRQIFAKYQRDWDVGAIIREGGGVLSQQQMEALNMVSEAQRAVIESNRYGQSLFDTAYKNSP